MSEPLQGIFDDVMEFPDLQAKRRFDQLVGLDEIKARLLKEGSLLLNPALLDQWSKKHYQRPIPLVEVFRDRPPLFLFAGDVGTGKTTLAKNFGDPTLLLDAFPEHAIRLGRVLELARAIRPTPPFQGEAPWQIPLGDPF